MSLEAFDRRLKVLESKADVDEMLRMKEEVQKIKLMLLKMVKKRPKE